VGPETKGYLTPDEAALSGFDPRFARVVRVVRSQDWSEALVKDDDHMVVELATNEPPREYPYFVFVERRQGLWFEGMSHN
jgi:hypothetical protein